MNLLPPLPFSQSGPKTKTDRNQGEAAASIEIEAQQVGNKEKSIISSDNASIRGTESTWYFIGDHANKQVIIIDNLVSQAFHNYSQTNCRFLLS